MGLGPGIFPPHLPTWPCFPSSLAYGALRPKARSSHSIPSHLPLPGPNSPEQLTPSPKQSLTPSQVGKHGGHRAAPQGPGGSPSSAWRKDPCPGPRGECCPLPPARTGQGSPVCGEEHRVCGEEHGIGILHPALPHSPHNLDQVTSLAGVIPRFRSTLRFRSLPFSSFLPLTGSLSAGHRPPRELGEGPKGVTRPASETPPARQGPWKPNTGSGHCWFPGVRNSRGSSEKHSGNVPCW